MTRYTPLCLALVLAACSSAPAPNGVSRAVVERAESTITAEEIRARVAFLASDELRGRDTPSPGLDSAAAWAARELAAFGLEPAAGASEWIQRYPYPLEGLDARETRFEITAGATHTLEYGTDFFVAPGHTPDGAVEAVYLGPAEAVERLPEEELRGRAVVLTLDGRAEPARGGYRLDRASRQVADGVREIALNAGAAAVVFILDETVTPREIAALGGTAAAPSRTAGGRGAGAVPAFYVSRSAAVRMFRMAGLDSAEQLRRARLDRAVPLPGVTLRLASPLRRLDDASAPNVVAVLPGRDPELRDTYVVLSAHMDHVGVGTPVDGDSIYNGADDDASGTAAVLEVAEALASLPTPPRRSVLVLIVSGEEKGLLGSRWFVDHPTVPLDRVVANLNLDMVGRNAPDSIVVIGQEYSSLGPDVLDVARRNPDLGLTVSEDLWPEERFFFRSDHFAFAAREIPALFFFAGTHEDYHRPGDEVEKIDVHKNARVARLVFLLTHEIAESDQVPEWDRRGLREVRRLTGARD